MSGPAERLPYSEHFSEDDLWKIAVVLGWELVAGRGAKALGRGVKLFELFPIGLKDIIRLEMYTDSQRVYLFAQEVNYLCLQSPSVKIDDVENLVQLETESMKISLIDTRVGIERSDHYRVSLDFGKDLPK